MKLLQLNIWGGRLMHNIKQVIERENPDILCLQEVFSCASKAPFFFPRDNLEVLKAAFPDHFVSYAPTFDLQIFDDTSYFGNAVFSRFPITEENTVFTHLNYKENLVIGQDTTNRRNVQHATLDISGTPIHILNHHGYHVAEHKNGNAETDQHMKIIYDYAQKISEPILITGDFNLSPDSQSLKDLNKDYRNLCIEHNIQTTRNALSSKTETCDYIFVNDSIHVQHFGVLPDVISDHAALVIEFDI